MVKSVLVRKTKPFVMTTLMCFATVVNTEVHRKTINDEKMAKYQKMVEKCISEKQTCIKKVKKMKNVQKKTLKVDKITKTKTIKPHFVKWHQQKKNSSSE